MKKIAMWLAVMALGLCLGCESAGERFEQQLRDRPDIHINLKFRKGQIVDLKIGGKGQIISVSKKNEHPYRVRVRTDEGSKYLWFHEFELEITP